MESKKEEKETKEKDRDKKEWSKVDGNAIVSPKNTKKLYGKKKLYQSETRPGDSEEVNTSLPEDIEYADENIFPSAP